MNKKWMTGMAVTAVLLGSMNLQAGAANDKQVLKDELGKIHNVVGHLGKALGKTDEERGLNALELVKGNLGFAKANGNFKVTDSHVDENGTTHVKFEQVINGIPVLGQQAIAHIAGDEVLGVTGGYASLVANAKEVKVTAQTAIDKALANIGATGVAPNAATAQLVYLPQGDKAILAYQVGVMLHGDKTGRWTVVVDAQDSTILLSKSDLEFATGTGSGMYSGTHPLNTTLRSGAYYLEDESKYMYTQQGSTIETYTCRNSTTTSYYITDTDNIWNTDPAAVDAHYYTGLVYDYWYNKWGRNSYDNAGAPMYVYVHYASGYNNAYWDGTGLVIGDGDGVQFRYLTCLDVIAHEWMHAVTEHTANLTYSNQSGALNESWSDAFAVTMDSGDWTIGEDCYTPGTAGDAMRSLSNPTAYGQPATMSAYVNTTSDNGGVHTNSGIPNKAFYNFATAIGSRDTAMKIWYIALRDYMTSSTNFSAARAATLQAAAALYGSTSSTYTALQTAWTNVGVN
jgi:bacillolysin